MKRIDVDDIKLIEAIGSGAYSEVYKCRYNGSIYAFKSLYDASRVFDNSFLTRLEYLNSLDLKRTVKPLFIVSQDYDTNVGYLTEICKQEDICMLDNPIIRFEALQDAKESILELHEYGIIHGDIYKKNFVLKDGKRLLIDLDNCDIRSVCISMNIRNSSYPANRFIEKSGLIQNLDIYLFNILTFVALNNLNSSSYTGTMFEFEKCMATSDFGVFDSYDSKKTCLTTLRYEPDGFLIDTIEPQKLYKLDY